MVSFEMDMAALGALQQAARRAALLTAESLKTDLIAAQTMPFDTGALQGSLHTDQFQDGDSVHTILQTDGPYARRLYFHPEYNFQKVNNPNAGAAWYAPYLEGGQKAGLLRENFAKNLKEQMK